MKWRIATRISLSVLPHRKSLRPQPRREFGLHPRGNPLWQACEPFDEIEPQFPAMGADEASGLRAGAMPLETRFGCEPGHANVQAAARSAAGIAITECAALPDGAIEFDRIDGVVTA